MKTLLLFIVYFSIFEISAQVVGVVANEENEVLAFASVYLDGTTKGTMANSEGMFELVLEPGEYRLVFQYTGYIKHYENIHYKGGRLELKVFLKESKYNLNEIVFSASREDPAYEIIRKAIAKRKLIEGNIKNYSCNAYTKGLMKILNAPQKILGRDIGNLNGQLDTNRQGIVYLSESISKLKFFKPDILQEVMISSKVSGNDNGFSFNRATALNFNLYQNTIPFGREIISPISDYALSHYHYRLEGSNMDTDGRQIHKIKLIPIIKNDPVWSGYIYIEDQKFIISEFDAFIKGSQVKQEIFDTLFLRQTHFLTEKEHQQKVQSQYFGFNAGILGFKMEGKFTIVYSEYQFDGIEDTKDKRELLEILPGANIKTIEYWDKERPVPLTKEEIFDYVRKDSIKLIKESKPYLDSMDRIANRLSLSNILLGYSYRNSYDRMYFNTNGIFQFLSFNPVQGGLLDFKIKHSFYVKKMDWNKSLNSDFSVNYGFSEKKLRVQLGVNYRMDALNNRITYFKFGQTVNEYSPFGLVDRLSNSMTSLFLKVNRIKMYDEKYFLAGWAQDIGYDFRFKLNLKLSERHVLDNHTNFSFRFEEKPFESNKSAGIQDSILTITKPQLIQFSIGLRYQPGTKVWKTPTDLQKLGSKWPVFNLNLHSNYYVLGKTWVPRIDLSVRYEAGLVRWGNFIVSSYFSLIPKNSEPDIPERIYANGNPFIIYTQTADPNFFRGLQIYQIIEKNRLFSMHLEHDFQGLFLDRIPWVNKLGLVEVFKASLLSTSDYRLYKEISFGLGNIGYKAFRLFRIDWVKSYYSGAASPSYIRIGMDNFINVGR